jgi:hypothetical protein
MAIHAVGFGDVLDSQPTLLTFHTPSIPCNLFATCHLPEAVQQAMVD